MDSSERLKEEIVSYEKKYKIISPNDKLSELLHSSIVLKLHRKAAYQEKASDDEIQQMKDVISKLYPTFIEKLMIHDLHLKHNYINVCCLLKIGFIPAEIAVLLCTSPQNVSNIRSRVYQIMTKKNGSSKDFNNLLKKIY